MQFSCFILAHCTGAAVNASMTNDIFREDSKKKAKIETVKEEDTAEERAKEIEVYSTSPALDFYFFSWKNSVFRVCITVVVRLPTGVTDEDTSNVKVSTTCDGVLSTLVVQYTWSKAMTDTAKIYDAFVAQGGDPNGKQLHENARSPRRLSQHVASRG